MPPTPAQSEHDASSIPTPSSAAGRAFYQARIQLYFFVISSISFIFFLLHNWLEVAFDNLRFDQVFSLPLNRWHLAGASIAAALALCLRGRSFTTGTLDVIDAAGTVAVLAAYDMMASTILGVPAPHFDLVLTLAYMLMQMTRAVIVPSTVRRTLVVCVVSALPLLWMGWLLAARAPDAWSAARTLYAPLYIALWCLQCVIPAALASGVIYGLRQQVRQASKLGQYTLEERIGEGGMGTVYRARHALLRRPTAIKLLRPERTGDQALARFEREVQLTSQLTHPNTVAIYDYGHSADGTFYYAMEYLDGLDLQRLVALDGPQDPARVIHILSQVCGALSEAHGLGLIHRDIKPANIILCARGGAPDVAKVVDFGLVKSLSGDEDPGLSSTQTIVGTPHFLAPEAIRASAQVGAHSDLYAVGAVGYYLLAGVHVFDGDGTIEICGQHLHATPRSIRERVGRTVPAALEAVLLRCLRKDPSERPESALALAAELAACGISEWTAAQANAFWARVPARSAEQSATSATDAEVAMSPTLLEISLQGRARPS